MVNALAPQVAASLARGGTVQITTIGRRSGEPRRVELAFHNVGGRILLSGRPGFRRSWVANLRANPRFTFHLLDGSGANLPATGRVITDRAERELLLAPIARAWHIDLAIMVASAPLVEVTFSAV